MRRLIIAMCVTGGVALAAAQGAPNPAFEVATVKQNKEGGPGSFIRRLPGGRIETTNFPARLLITFAYQLAPFQLVGGPSWLVGDRFDIVAKMEGGDPPAQVPGSGPDAIQLAMRGFLADRFKLKVHTEMRDMDIYALTVAKPGSLGPALKPAATDCATVAAARRGQPPPQAPPSPTAPVQCGIMGGPGRIRFGGFPLSQVTTMLAQMTGRMVVDRTGLTGNWEFELHFAPDPGVQPPPGANVPPPNPDEPSLYTAIQEQLGLKLESAKAPVEVMVIDSVEKPAED